MTVRPSSQRKGKTVPSNSPKDQSSLRSPCLYIYTYKLHISIYLYVHNFLSIIAHKALISLDLSHSQPWLTRLCLRFVYFQASSFVRPLDFCLVPENAEIQEILIFFFFFWFRLQISVTVPSGSDCSLRRSVLKVLFKNKKNKKK